MADLALGQPRSSVLCHRIEFSDLETIHGIIWPVQTVTKILYEHSPQKGGPIGAETPIV